MNALFWGFLPISVPAVFTIGILNRGYERFTGREGPLRKYERGYQNPEKKARKYKQVACKRSLKKEAPKPLPATRKRALTLPLPECPKPAIKGLQNTSQQEDSTFFSRFPPEIRRIIYSYVLTSDHDILQIYRKADRRLSHHKCDYDHQDCGEESIFQFVRQVSDWYYDEERFYTASGALKTTAEYTNREHDLLPLLQTCRRVYVLYLPNPNNRAELS